MAKFLQNPLAKIPTGKEIVLDHGDKVVSALAIDPSGSRLVTGSYDYTVKFWDFQGMSTTLNAFRTITPFDRYLMMFIAILISCMISTGMR